MRAAVRERYGSPEVVEIREIPIPAPGEGDVLVKVRWASINTADLDLMRGVPPVTRVAYGLRQPRNGRLGADMVGEVVEAGTGVEAFQLGDVVWADLFEAGHAAFSEYVSVRAKALHHKPPQLEETVAATLPHSGLLALQSLRHGNVQPGESVLINGAGGCVGPFAIQIAKTREAIVTGVDRTEKLDFMRQVGADRVEDYTSTDITREGDRYDVILDIAATRSPLAFRSILNDGGRYVHLARSLAGFFRAAASGGLTNRWSRSRISNFSWKANNGDDLTAVGRLAENGAITPRIDNTFDLAHLRGALSRHAAGEARGKILISVDGTHRPHA
jgi:NADPH:quinone reductase-like Zn-dependent oxidoreductase